MQKIVDVQPSRGSILISFDVTSCIPWRDTPTSTKDEFMSILTVCEHLTCFLERYWSPHRLPLRDDGCRGVSLVFRMYYPQFRQPPRLTHCLLVSLCWWCSVSLEGSCWWPQGLPLAVELSIFRNAWFFKISRTFYHENIGTTSAKPVLYSKVLQQKTFWCELKLRARDLSTGTVIIR